MDDSFCSILFDPVQHVTIVIMRQGRGSEATEAVFCLQAKKPLHNGSYEHRVPKTKKQNIIL